MPSYRTEAINLRSSRFSEADKLVTFFTRDSGKVSALAKSAFKPGSRFGGRLEPLCYNSVLLAKGRNLDILSQIETIETFHTIRESERRLEAGLYIARLLYHFLEERTRNEGLFLLALECLRLLKTGALPAAVTRLFDIRFADIEGFLPMDNFSSDLRGRVEVLRLEQKEIPRLSQAELSGIDSVLVPRLSEHVGKDVGTWKRS